MMLERIERITGARTCRVSSSSTAYWYAERPAGAVELPPVARRLAVPRDNQGVWLTDRVEAYTPRTVPRTPLMQEMKKRWKTRG